jgi:hypothetical protein
VILVDADILLIDLRYPNDSRFPINRQALDQIHSDRLPIGATSEALLETVDILSVNVSPVRIGRLANQLTLQYALSVFPDLQAHPEYAGCLVEELVAQMSRQMALGDAVQAVQIQLYVPWADCLLTWNAEHFSGKLVIPVLTPQEWLGQQCRTPDRLR